MAKQGSSSSQYRRTTGTQGTARKTGTTRRRATTSTQSNVTFSFPWTRQNVIGIGAGIAVIILGYILMSTGISSDVANNEGVWNSTNAVTIGPILLTIGYCVIIPYFIFKRYKREEVVEE